MEIRIPGQARPENDGTLLTNATPVAAEWFKPRKAERPNWRKWRNMPAVELWQAVALSLGIEPPKYHPRGTIPDFDEREDVVLRCLALGNLRAVKRDESRQHCSLVRLTDIAAVAESLPDPWPLPDEFPRPSAAPAANAPPPSQAKADANTKPKRETQAERIKQCVTDCEQRAAERGERFDRERMPGTKAEFHNLLHALDAELRSIKTVDSLDRYLSKTGCKWPLNAGKQSSAAPLYARLFPEARIRAPGAVSPQRRKA